MSLLPFFEWCENTAIGGAIRNSVWLFPVIESFHLVALALIGGAVLLVNMRLLGLVLGRRPVSELARRRAAVVPRRSAGDVRLWRSPLPVRVHQVLLQLRVLGEDVGAPRSPGVHLHRPSARHAGGRGARRARAGQARRRGLAGALGRCGLGRPVDRVFVENGDLGIWVPYDMEERYESRDGRRLEATSSYSNFQQFNVDIGISVSQRPLPK